MVPRTNRLAELGLPVQAGGAEVLGLHYNVASRSLAVRVGVEHRRFRLFVRPLGSGMYREVLPLGPGREFHALVDAESSPLMFVLEKSSSESRIAALALPAATLTELPAAHDGGESYRVWVVALITATADAGSVLVVSACASTPTHDGGQTIDHFIARASRGVNVKDSFHTRYAGAYERARREHVRAGPVRRRGCAPDSSPDDAGQPFP